MEVLIVLFIISIAAAIVFPSISTQGHIRGDAKLVASILKHVYDTTLATREICHIQANIRSKQLSYACPSERRSFEVSTLIKIETTTVTPTPEGDFYIFFTPGLQDNIKIHLSEGHNFRIVHLNTLSGRVKIIEV